MCKLEIEGNFLNFIYWHTEWWNIGYFPLEIRNKKGYPFSALFGSVGPNQFSKARKWSKWYKDGKRRNEITFTYRRHDSICQKAGRIHKSLELIGECSKVNI